MYRLKNCNEDVVELLADQLIPESGMCSCAKCRLDVMAIALNQLPPTYVVSLKGELFASIDATLVQHQADAIAAVMIGIRQVMNTPKHDSIAVAPADQAQP